MKTSNIIVISLIASVTLIITTGMVEFRIKGVHRGVVADKWLEFTPKAVPAFHFITIQDCSNVTLVASDAFVLNLVEPKEGVTRLSYEVKHDTLYVKGAPDLDRGDPVSINAPAHQVRSVQALHSRVTVTSTSLDQFVIRADESSVSMDTHLAINTLIVEGVNNSRIDFFQTNVIQTLELNLDHSEMHTNSPLEKLKGSIRNHSTAQVNNVGELTFTKDRTSRLQVWGN